MLQCYDLPKLHSIEKREKGNAVWFGSWEPERTNDGNKEEYMTYSFPFEWLLKTILTISSHVVMRDKGNERRKIPIQPFGPMKYKLNVFVAPELDVSSICMFILIEKQFIRSIPLKVELLFIFGPLTNSSSTCLSKSRIWNTNLLVPTAARHVGEPFSLRIVAGCPGKWAYRWRLRSM